MNLIESQDAWTQGKADGDIDDGVTEIVDLLDLDDGGHASSMPESHAAPFDIFAATFDVAAPARAASLVAPEDAEPRQAVARQPQDIMDIMEFVTPASSELYGQTIPSTAARAGVDLGIDVVSMMSSSGVGGGNSFLESLDGLDEVCAAGDKPRGAERCDEVELIPGLLGTGRWRRLKGGVTIDSGCSLDIMPGKHAPNLKTRPKPRHRIGRVIKAANGTKINEYGMKKLKFRTKLGNELAWTWWLRT